jgi:sulfatase maturation enzyme AslB (radical SAM superfamily)
MAKKIIDYLHNLLKVYSSSSSVQPIMIGFYGGEPLMNSVQIQINGVRAKEYELASIRPFKSSCSFLSKETTTYFFKTNLPNNPTKDNAI